ncbi:thioredoxin family protein [Chryseobacterium pennipullorum]|uniref:Thioredoxin n=1 Tax=Chryseobacterium pennipullorum TaxID=2258963 RepID=A0A3D9B1S0_9FLAO|nr:thioredoxin family protein [Chryseobacterium pennipullorum]REC47533.1 thiol reductase thioredoxin [Chryseobacterium pennipullorum]
MNLDEIIKSDKPTLVNFHATWCMPCVMMKPQLEEVVESIGDQIQYERIDIDQNHELASHLQIRSVPTTMIFQSNELKWRESGIYSSESLIKILSDLLKSN